MHYFNAGRFGPTLRPVAEAVRAELAEELAGRRGMMSDRVEALLADVRARVCDLLKAPPGSVALTHNTTEGINFAVASRRWSEGDEIVTLTTEHESGLAPLQVARERFGVRVVRMDPAPEPQETLDRILAALTPRTRMVMVSHASWTTGALAPAREISDACHERGVVVVVDGAQTAGVISLDVAALDVDFYAIPGQKWLLGPSGTGALYVRPELVADSHPPVAGFASAGDFDPETGACTWFDDARRFEGASDSVPLRRGMGEALRWLAEDVGWEWIHRRIREMVQRCRSMLEDIPGVTVATQPGDQAGIVTFGIDGVRPEAIVDHLSERRVIVRVSLPPPAVRVCVGFFTTESDLAALREGILSIRGDHH
jgi:L-cysteine/cystine lyase